MNFQFSKVSLEIRTLAQILKRLPTKAHLREREQLHENAWEHRLRWRPELDENRQQRTATCWTKMVRSRLAAQCLIDDCIFTIDTHDSISYCYIIWYVLQVWYMYYTWWLCVKLADADLHQVLAGLGLEMEQLRLKLSCAVQWLGEAVTPCTDRLDTFSYCPTTSYCLSTSLKFCEIIWQWYTMINYYLSVIFITFWNHIYMLSQFQHAIDVELMDDFFLIGLVYQRWCIFCKDLPHNKPEEVTVLAVYRLPIPSPAQAWTWKQRWQKTKRTVGPVGPVGPRLGWTPTDPVLSLLFTVPLTVGNEYNM